MAASVWTDRLPEAIDSSINRINRSSFSASSFSPPRTRVSVVMLIVLIVNLAVSCASLFSPRYYLGTASILAVINSTRGTALLIFNNIWCVWQQASAQCE